MATEPVRVSVLGDRLLGLEGLAAPPRFDQGADRSAASMRMSNLVW